MRPNFDYAMDGSEVNVKRLHEVLLNLPAEKYLELYRRMCEASSPNLNSFPVQAMPLFTSENVYSPIVRKKKGGGHGLAQA